MILSVSRRTDIPNYYADWFLNRIREGFLYVKNPMNPHQISRIDLSPDIVDCIVFWTKNPADIMERLCELKDYSYYFQFTLTGYGRDIEPGLPDKRSVLIPVFRDLSDKIGKKRVVWRYDPIFFNERYTQAYHFKAFEEICDRLAGYTGRVVISFLDFYAKTRRNMAGISIEMPADDECVIFAGKLAGIAEKYGMEIFSCAERIDLQAAGIRHGSCIDRALIEEIVRYRLSGSKDRNQRKECGCMESVEVGAYDTCLNGCQYCYANACGGAVKAKREHYDEMAPMLCGRIVSGDRITERKVRLLKTDR